MAPNALTRCLGARGLTRCICPRRDQALHLLLCRFSSNSHLEVISYSVRLLVFTYLKHVMTIARGVDVFFYVMSRIQGDHTILSSFNCPSRGRLFTTGCCLLFAIFSLSCLEPNIANFVTFCDPFISLSVMHIYSDLPSSLNFWLFGINLLSRRCSIHSSHSTSSLSRLRIAHEPAFFGAFFAILPSH